jgi:hypothetical protein
MATAYNRRVIPLVPLDDAAEREIERLETLIRARKEVLEAKNQLRLHAERTERVRTILREKLAAAETHLQAVLATEGA